MPRPSLIGALFLGLAGCGSPPGLQFVDTFPLAPHVGDVVTVRFAAYDANGKAVPNLLVSFALVAPLEGAPSTSGVPGLELNPTSAATAVYSGLVETQVTASEPASAAVQATYERQTVLSPGIGFVAEKP